MSNQKNNIISVLFAISIVVVFNILGNFFAARFDLTSDQRYTLSETSVNIVNKINAPLVIDVFLEGQLPAEFRRLKEETKQLLEEFSVINPQININYIDILENNDERQRIIDELISQGLEPYVNNRKKNASITQELIFPWAYASYKGKRVKIPLLKKSISKSLPEQISNSIEHLEYNFANGFDEIINSKTKSVAILKGNGQLSDIYINSFLQTIYPHYNIAKFTLDSVATNPRSTAKDILKYDLIISAKPTQSFSENEKLVLDQYTMQGGKSIWLTEAVIFDKDSLRSKNGSISITRDLKLNDFFFKYGVRINPNLIKSLNSSPILLAVGQDSQTQLQPLQWPYSPFGLSKENHPINKNLELVNFDFASPIDTLKNNIKKTILLQSDVKSKLEGTPTKISLDIVTQNPDIESFNKGPQNLAVLLEGEFTSVYDKRILPFEIDNYKSKSVATKMVVISDGDVIKNEVSRNQPQELGFDRYSGRRFGNKEFLLNTINYLLDDTGLINLRTKNIKVAFLNPEKVKNERGTWQFINMVLPLLILSGFAGIFYYLRKRKFSI